MKGQAKVRKVLHEFKEGALKSSSGQKVSSRDQAIAIAMSEAGMSKNKHKAEHMMGKGARMAPKGR